MSEPLTPKTPGMMKSIRSVKISFTDGTTRDIFVEGNSTEGFYKEETIARDKLTDHTVYIVNGRIRDTPALELNFKETS